MVDYGLIGIGLLSVFGGGFMTGAAVVNQYEPVFTTQDGTTYDIKEVLLALRLACARVLKGADQGMINMLAIQLLREAKASIKEHKN